jgi:Glyoxalase-like domain
MLHLDHGLIFVTDLQAAAASYQRLGFVLTPRGRHPSLGTANHTIMFERDYLELITVMTRSPANERWSAILDRGEGLGAVALGTNDARAVAATLRSRGIAVPEVVDFERPVRLGERQAAARFSVAHLPPDASPAIPAFFCQHHTRDLVWLPHYQRHPNTARAVAGMVVAVRNPERMTTAYERLLGRAAVHPHPSGLEVDLLGTRLLLVDPAFVATRLGRHLDVPGDGARPVGITIAVSDLGATRRELAANAVPFAPFGKASILVGPTFTHGVYLEFLAT